MKGKNVIVTGAGKGIGKAIALMFASNGANIVLNYRSNEPTELIEEIKSLGVKCLPIKCDVSDFSQASDLIKEAKEAFSTIDVLINNAGITKDGLIMRMAEEQFDDVITTNLKGTFNTIRHITPIMMKQRFGAIINLSSVVGLSGNAGQVNYSASKAGVIGLTKSVAKELASRNITCNAIAPGFIETDMTEAMTDTAKEAMLGFVPLKRAGKACEVAEVALFLAKATYVTGQVIQIDGGLLM